MTDTDLGWTFAVFGAGVNNSILGDIVNVWNVSRLSVGCNFKVSAKAFDAPVDTALAATAVTGWNNEVNPNLGGGIKLDVGGGVKTIDDCPKVIGVKVWKYWGVPKRYIDWEIVEPDTGDDVTGDGVGTPNVTRDINALALSTSVGGVNGFIGFVGI